MRYLKQALALIREEKLYSAMYIAGTALAVAFVMLIAEVYYVKVADIAPEVRRSTTYYLDDMTQWDKEDDQTTELKNISYEMYRDLFQKMQTPDCMAAEMEMWSTLDITLADSVHEYSVKGRLTDTGFFRLYQFHFIEGAPFTQDDYDNGRNNVVITEELREQLFGHGQKAIGQTLTLDHHTYRICGVVETPSALTEKCVADIWMPCTVEDPLRDRGLHNMVMSMHLAFSVPAVKRDAFLQELKDIEARYNALHKEEPVTMTDRLQTHYEQVWHDIGYVFNAWDVSLFWYVTPSILLLLLVPALNLSGMVASRMERRLPEMAIRKAFGAKRRTLLGEVIMENLVLTIIGGSAGLCLAWTALYGWRDWVFYVFSESDNLYGTVPLLKGEMFFGPAVFVIALLVCSVLNVLAATLPAWLSLRKPIVESMMIKK
jgi:putative ABC transport system permease protein